MYFFLAHVLSYWSFAALYCWLDFYGKRLFPIWHRRYKIEEMTDQQLKEEYLRRIPVVLFNQFTVQFINLTVLEYFTDPSDVSYFTSFINMIINFTYSLFVFTLFHYLMHQYLYEFHKKHHELKNTIAVNSEYNSVTEEVVNWTISTWASCFIFRMNFDVSVLCIIAHNFSDLMGHAGYKFNEESMRHYLHHKKTIVNYAAVRWIDVAMKTNMDFEAPPKALPTMN